MRKELFRTVQQGSLSTGTIRQLDSTMGHVQQYSFTTSGIMAPLG